MQAHIDAQVHMAQACAWLNQTYIKQQQNTSTSTICSIEAIYTQSRSHCCPDFMPLKVILKPLLAFFFAGAVASLGCAGFSSTSSRAEKPRFICTHTSASPRQGASASGLAQNNPTGTGASIDTHAESSFCSDTMCSWQPDLPPSLALVYLVLPDIPLGSTCMELPLRQNWHYMQTSLSSCHEHITCCWCGWLGAA